MPPIVAKSSFVDVDNVDDFAEHYSPMLNHTVPLNTVHRPRRVAQESRV